MASERDRPAIAMTEREAAASARPLPPFVAAERIREYAAASARVQFLLANPDELRKFVSAAEQNADDFIALNHAYSELRAASAPQPLSVDRIRAIANDVGMFNVEYEDFPGEHCERFARAIEAAQGIGLVPLAPQDTGGK